MYTKRRSESLSPDRCAQIAKSWTEAFDMLLDAYQEIAENIPLLKQYSALFSHDNHMRWVLRMIYGDILEFHKRAIRYFTRPSKLHPAMLA